MLGVGGGPHATARVAAALPGLRHLARAGRRQPDALRALRPALGRRGRSAAAEVEIDAAAWRGDRPALMCESKPSRARLHLGNSASGAHRGSVVGQLAVRSACHHDPLIWGTSCPLLCVVSCPCPRWRHGCLAGAIAAPAARRRPVTGVKTAVARMLACLPASQPRRSKVGLTARLRRRVGPPHLPGHRRQPHPELKGRVGHTGGIQFTAKSGHQVRHPAVRDRHTGTPQLTAVPTLGASRSASGPGRLDQRHQRLERSAATVVKGTSSSPTSARSTSHLPRQGCREEGHHVRSGRATVTLGS